MKLLQSKKMNIPIIYLIYDDKDLNKLPLGIPFIIGSYDYYDEYVKMIEYDILLKSALKTKLPFDWYSILNDLGYENLYETVAYSEQCCYINDDNLFTIDKTIDTIVKPVTISKLIEDISYNVDIEYLKNLKVIPSWFSETIEENIKNNIFDSISWNPFLYNKKLDNITGAISLNNQEKNLIICDISSSIPKSIAKSLLMLSGTMSNLFYADLIITGRRSKLFDYEEINSLDIDEIYQIYGNSQECKDFRQIVSEHKKYNNVIVFGDNHTPLYGWYEEKEISFKQAYHICKFKVNKIYSFHVTENNKLAGYAEMFDCQNIEYMKNWVKDLNKNIK